MKQVNTDKTTSESYSVLKEMIIQLLSQKATVEMKRQDALNQTNLGGVNFYFNEAKDDVYLCWDKPFKDWDENAIIEEIEIENRQLLRQRGLLPY